MQTTITVTGGVTGTLWMPAIQGWRGTERRFAYRRDNGGPWEPRVESLKQALEAVAADDGDFQTAGRLTADTRITVTRTEGRRSVSRRLYVEQFPRALKDLVDFDVYSYDAEDAEEGAQ